VPIEYGAKLLNVRRIHGEFLNEPGLALPGGICQIYYRREVSRPTSERDAA